MEVAEAKSFTSDAAEKQTRRLRSRSLRSAYERISSRRMRSIGRRNDKLTYRRSRSIVRVTQYYDDRQAWEACEAFYGPTLPLVGHSHMSNGPSKGGMVVISDVLAILAICVLFITYIATCCHRRTFESDELFLPVESNKRLVAISCIFVGLLAGLPLVFESIVELVAELDAALWCAHYKHIPKEGETARKVEEHSGSSIGRWILNLYNIKSNLVVNNGGLVLAVKDEGKGHETWLQYTISVMKSNRILCSCCFSFVFMLFNLLMLLTVDRHDRPNSIYLIMLVYFTVGMLIQKAIHSVIGNAVLRSAIWHKLLSAEVKAALAPNFPHLPDGRVFISHPGFAYITQRCNCHYRIPQSAFFSLENRQSKS